MNPRKTLSKLFIFCTSFFLLIACGTQLFINKPAENYQEFSCVVRTDICGIIFKNGGSIKYEVTETENLKFKVKGKVDVDWISTGTSKFVIFYVLFMDHNKVIHEERIRTRSTHTSFGFEFETKTPILTSSLEKIRWMVRS
jgi:hypothetical protein